ncbi:hypothetical protein AC579_4863 [Pseudocercospora musae]|uniref:Uncharacterized protein n=1 Tax=Pseudocercospora musae TaxID=113226 RepID=A0A139IKG0_9PEZI|nr:hypothetical protein AC579_4863 [Pseudocercospora musae]
MAAESVASITEWSKAASNARPLSSAASVAVRTNDLIENQPKSDGGECHHMRVWSNLLDLGFQKSLLFRHRRKTENIY